MIYVARQLGHGADLTLGTYGHVIEELEDAPQLPAEEAIRRARSERVCLESIRPLEADRDERNPCKRGRPDQDSNLGPTP